MRCVKPLVLLMKKDMEFVWGLDQKASMEDLKQEVVTSPCLWPIDYHMDQCVILAIDLSCIATGFILSQLGMDDCQNLSPGLSEFVRVQTLASACVLHLPTNSV